MRAGKIQMVINTHSGSQTGKDSQSIRRACVMERTPYFTTLSAARATVQALSEPKDAWTEPVSLQARRG